MTDKRLTDEELAREAERWDKREATPIPSRPALSNKSSESLLGLETFNA